MESVAIRLSKDIKNMNQVFHVSTDCRVEQTTSLKLLQHLW